MPETTLRTMVDNRTLGPTTYPKRHLFFDADNVVECDLSAEQRFYQAEKISLEGLKQGRPGSWDARITSAYGTTLVEDGLFRKWFACMPDASHSDKDPDHWVTCYAESEDGVRWRKPDLKITGQRRWPGNNLAGLPGGVMSVVRALPNAGCKYLALALHKWPEPEPDVCEDVKLNGPGMYLFGSDDGLRWHQITRNPILCHGDWAILHTDHVKERYLLYNKVGANHGLMPRRSALEIESRDGIHWRGSDGTRQWQDSGTRYPHGWSITPDFTDPPGHPDRGAAREPVARSGETQTGPDGEPRGVVQGPVRRRGRA